VQRYDIVLASISSAISPDAPITNASGALAPEDLLARNPHHYRSTNAGVFSGMPLD